MTQTHKVATDALETLGMLIPENSGRDAIHLAVEPVVAGEALEPGQRIKLIGGNMAFSAREADAIGIVDPFLRLRVMPDQRFWLVVLPRTITSLRHVWSHPAFPEERQFHSDADEHYVASGKEAAEQWLRAYAEQIDEGFHTLIAAADEWVADGEYFYGAKLHGYHGKFEGESTHPDFWKHYQVFKGQTVDPDKQENFFTCSC